MMRDIIRKLHIVAIVCSAIASGVAATLGAIDPFSAAAIGATANGAVAVLNALT